MLTQLPGIGPFTALVILAEIGEVSRFGSARKLASWAGLTPTVRSGEIQGGSVEARHKADRHSSPAYGSSQRERSYASGSRLTAGFAP